MDDVSKIQQINNLARELMKHGQAGSMEQAIQLATQQVEGGAVPVQEQQNTEVVQELQPVEHHEIPPVQEQQMPEPQHSPQTEHLSEQQESTTECCSDKQKIESLIKEQQNSMNNLTDAINKDREHIKSVEQKINGIIADMSNIKQQLEKMSNSPVTPPMKPKDVNQGQTQFKGERTPPPVEKKPEPHARSGNYQPEDVSIEKIFYYGNR
ncbi:hypothetical protein HQ545_00940 [Candidatus Woesearchaeota archaeon]|nr:hypothetical protein [Candidatus Woesearchaeota archaeon]